MKISTIFSKNENHGKFPPGQRSPMPGRFPGGRAKKAPEEGNVPFFRGENVLKKIRSCG